MSKPIHEDYKLPAILEEMRDVYESRNGQYEDAYLTAGSALARMLPQNTIADMLSCDPADYEDKLNDLILFIMCFHKLNRFAKTLEHPDSAIDLANYSAMLVGSLKRSTGGA